MNININNSNQIALVTNNISVQLRDSFIICEQKDNNIQVGIGFSPQGAVTQEDIDELQHQLDKNIIYEEV